MSSDSAYVFPTLKAKRRLSEITLIEHRITIQNKLGMHARAASSFVKVSQGYGASITVRNGPQSADGKSIMSMMMLQATIGTEILLILDGDDEIAAQQALIELIDNRFGESE
ncbi:MAG: phosphocarrier protein [Candidatus Azotimanducaceae bacterium]|jgi:phosphocarrier protein